MIESRYGVDDAVSTPGRIVGKVDWLDDAARWAAKRRIDPAAPTSRTTSFQVVATIEPHRAGHAAVQVMGIVAGSAARLPGQGPATIETGDARMPAVGRRPGRGHPPRHRQPPARRRRALTRARLPPDRPRPASHRVRRIDAKPPGASIAAKARL